MSKDENTGLLHFEAEATDCTDILAEIVKQNTAIVEFLCREPMLIIPSDSGVIL